MPLTDSAVDGAALSVFARRPLPLLPSAVRRRPRRKLNHFARQPRRALYFGGDHCAQAVEHVLSEPHQRKRKVFFDLMHHQARPTGQPLHGCVLSGECCARTHLNARSLCGQLRRYESKARNPKSNENVRSELRHGASASAE
jgi:hypothetical protein